LLKSLRNETLVSLLAVLVNNVWQVRRTSLSTLIRTEDLHKSYLMGIHAVAALRGIDLEIKDGEFCSIMGPSGSGKSTLLHLVGGLDTPSKGSIYFEDANLALLSSDQLAEFRLRKVGFIFQTFHLVPTMTALENVRLPMGFAGLKRKDQDQRALKLLEMVGLKGRESHLPAELSGGEQQRVAVARALSNEPRVILADEPTGDLDSKTGQQIMEVLQELNEQGKTIVMVTHDVNLANYGHRVLSLLDGKLAKGA
jgi:putative ABC transport system ATP-binding protein